MNEYQNAGERCAFFQCGPCRRYLYAQISQDIRSSSLHVYYYIVVLKNLAKLTGMHLHQKLFSTCSLQLHRKRDAGIYRFQWDVRNFLGILLLWKTSCGLVLKREILWKMENQHFYYNKDISWSPQLFQKTDTVRKMYLWETLIESWHWT